MLDNDSERFLKLLMSFGLIKSPCPVVLSKGLLLSELFLDTHNFSLPEGCLETFHSMFNCDQRRVLELRAPRVMLFLVFELQLLRH